MRSVYFSWELGITRKRTYVLILNEVPNTMKMISGTAVLTNVGIEFNGYHYSCKQAIRDQWFAIVDQMDPIHMEIYYDEDSINEIYLEFGSTWVTCLRVERMPQESSRADLYHLKFQALLARKLKQTFTDGREGES
jgi:hypothetical protein